MSGHSKWSTIKHKKGAADAKRGKLFSKLSRAIMVAAKEGGADPGDEPRARRTRSRRRARTRCRRTTSSARSPRARARAPTAPSFETVVYEGYGPEGVAVIVEALTDNRNRTAVRRAAPVREARRQPRRHRRGRLAVRAPRGGPRRRRRASTTRSSCSPPPTRAPTTSSATETSSRSPTRAGAARGGARGARGRGLHGRVGRALDGARRRPSRSPTRRSRSRSCGSSKGSRTTTTSRTSTRTSTSPRAVLEAVAS